MFVLFYQTLILLVPDRLLELDVRTHSYCSHRPESITPSCQEPIVTVATY